MRVSLTLNSPYYFNLQKSNPIINNNLGTFLSTDKHNWSILKSLSLQTYKLKPHVTTQAFWYLEVDALYCIIRGSGNIYLTIAGKNNNQNCIPIVNNSIVFVPAASQHVIQNTSTTEELYIVVYFSNNIHPFITLNDSVHSIQPKLLEESIVGFNISNPPSGHPISIPATDPIFRSLPHFLIKY